MFLINYQYFRRKPWSMPIQCYHTRDIFGMYLLWLHKISLSKSKRILNYKDSKKALFHVKYLLLIKINKTLTTCQTTLTTKRFVWINQLIKYLKTNSITLACYDSPVEKDKSRHTAGVQSCFSFSFLPSWFELELKARI